jgi:hypothetical protein
MNSRHVAALFLCGAVLVGPFLLIHNQASASSDPGPHAREGVAGSTGRTDSRATRLASDDRSRVASATSTAGTAGVVPSTTAPVTTTAPVETTLPAQVVVDHAVAPTTTAVTAPPTTTTTAPAAAATEASDSGAGGNGQVTYYGHPAGTCASPWLPFGTVVEITNPANGASVSCVVNDREADTTRSIDLATSTFAEIAPLSQGVIDAQLSW